MALQNAILLLLLLCTTINSECPEEHPQTKYCRAEFVLKVSITKPSTAQQITIDNNVYQILNMSMRTQIKISPTFMKLDDQQLQTVYIDERIWKTVLPGANKYIITGTIKSYNDLPILTINECDWLQSWTTVGHRHRAALRKSKFDSACECQINNNSVNKCKMPSNQNIHKCYLEHSYCSRRPTIGNNACHWSNNNELKLCISDLR